MLSQRNSNTRFTHVNYPRTPEFTIFAWNGTGTERKRGSRVVSALASCARGPGFDPRRRRGKFVGPNLLPFLSFAGMT